MQAQHVAMRGMYILRLTKDEDVFKELQNFCEEENITGATFSAIGAIKNTTLGYYNLAAKQYGSQEYDVAHEVASMTGNIALVEGKPFIHVHAVLSGIVPGTENQCVGGHVFAATVAVTLEVHMIVFNDSLTRSLDNDTRLKLLDCEVR